jgi:cytidylate kinase
MAKRLAKALGWRYLDTGALYRALALMAFEAGISAEDGDALGRLAQSVAIRQDQAGRTWVGDRDVSDAIRTSHIGAMASPVSAHPPVRVALVDLQRRVAADGDLVCEGRDMGSVIFPNADLKVYLDALGAVRADRRYQELVARGEVVPLDTVRLQLDERDARDQGRAYAPLKRLPDQVYLDTSDLSQNQVLDALLGLVEDCRRRVASLQKNKNQGGSK